MMRPPMPTSTARLPTVFSKSIRRQSTAALRALSLSTPFPAHRAHLSLLSFAESILRASPSPPLSSCRFASLSNAASLSGSSGGGVQGPDGGPGGSGEPGSGGGDGVNPSRTATSRMMSDAIILDVGGMSCGGCAAKVKRILESQPQVSSASVNFATETAVVWATPENNFVGDWKQKLGKKLAHYLTTCGFKSSLRDSSKEGFCNIFERKMDEKLQRIKESGRELALSCALCSVCLLGHVSHFLGTNAFSWAHIFHSTKFHLSLSLFTFLGPGRKLILDGWRSLLKGSPNMNTLVGLGALSSFSVSCIAALLPKLGWKTFFEEPIMLIAFVLLGKNLEQRAKLKATSDMTGLLDIIPTKARLLVKNDADIESSIIEIPCSKLGIGDHIVVLPGDRVPADGVVKAGRSTIDESSLTGEVMPVTKLPGAEVTAGSINLNGMLTVQVNRPGGDTAMGDIVRLVEEAQIREAPVQRLADKVAGNFTYGVIAFSAATFIFWKFFGSHLVPAVMHQGSSVSLALQLSCSVLVIACPCALGLATPTAVLVGTSLGARRGFLLRGGDVLEKFANVDSIVFDKTGTLTVGRPTVTRVVATESEGSQDSNKNLGLQWTQAEILTLAAGVEENTNHPVGKAIVEAARAANCRKQKVMDGTFREEPGSGAIAIIEQKTVTVGTANWLARHGVDCNLLPDEEPYKESIVFVGVDGNLAGRIYFIDKIREDAHHVVEYLSKQGISIYMLSGDKKITSIEVASSVGIPKDKVLSGVKPDEKKKFISKLQKERKLVAMVGDGINDAAALASADIGIAMGNGVGAASDVSSIILMGNKLSQLLDAFELSKRTMMTVKQNLWWAFAYNIVGIPIAAGVLLPVTGTILTPSVAGALMGLSSVSVMANSLLLRLKLGSKLKHEPKVVPASDVLEINDTATLLSAK